MASADTPLNYTVGQQRRVRAQTANLDRRFNVFRRSREKFLSPLSSSAQFEVQSLLTGGHNTATIPRYAAAYQWCETCRCTRDRQPKLRAPAATPGSAGR